MRLHLKVFILISLSAIAEGEIIDRSFSWNDDQIDQFYGKAAPQRGSIAQREALQDWNAKIAQSHTMPPSDAIPLLAGALFKLPRKNIFQISERVQVYDSAREALLAIPGHAKFFAVKLEEIRSADMTIGRINYARELHMCVAETLIHLPSPETVFVLGTMLEDTRDAPPPENPGRDMSSNSYMNPHLAAIALSKMEIRDYPSGQHFQPVLHRIEPWLEWWKEVKAGERTFSFEGQNVEYRFKPDGTWDTIPLVAFADDGSTAMEGSVSKVREKKVKQVPSQPEVPLNSRWGWITAATVFLLGAVLWFSLKSKRYK